MSNFKEITPLVIGIDLLPLCRVDTYPLQLQTYLINLIVSLITQAPRHKFIFFIEDLSLSEAFSKLLPEPNVAYALSGTERDQLLDCYFMPDQLTLIPNRVAPLHISPRTIPNSLLIPNLFLLNTAEKYLKEMPELNTFIYRHSLEAVTASPATIVVPSEIEAKFVKEKLFIPESQLCRLNHAGAVPFGFMLSADRWQQIQSRTGIGNNFVVFPKDLIDQPGFDCAMQYFGELKNKMPDLQMVIPDIRNYIANYLPAVVENFKYPEGVIHETTLAYSEFLEMLARSKAILIAGKLLAGAGMLEALEFGVPLCVVDQQELSVKQLQLSGLEDMLTIIKGKQVASNPLNLTKNWKQVANQIIASFEK